MTIETIDALPFRTNHTACEGTHMAIEAREIGAGLDPPERSDQLPPPARNPRSRVEGGLIAVWAAFLALAPAQALIYRWRWRRAMREHCR